MPSDAIGRPSSGRRAELSDLLAQHGLHGGALQVVRDGGEEVARVVALQRAAAAGEGGHDGLVVAQDLQAAEEQRLTLAARHHHLGEEEEEEEHVGGACSFMRERNV